MSKTGNRLPVKFEAESFIKIFKEIVYKFNHERSLDGEVLFTETELRKITNLTESQKLRDFMEKFISGDTRTHCFKVNNAEVEIYGGMFSAKVEKKENEKIIGFMINGYWKQYFYSKLDIDQWHELDRDNNKIKKAIKEENAEPKLLDIMTSVITNKIKGKYNLRLFDLLNGSVGSNNSGTFIMKWVEFKEVMEFPKSYQASNIEQKVLKPCRGELLKANIKITKIEKKKKGRSIDTLRILFKVIKEEKEKFKKEEEKEIIISEKLSKAISKAKKNRFIKPFITEKNISLFLERYGEEDLIRVLYHVYEKIQKEFVKVNYLYKTFDSFLKESNVKIVVGPLIGAGEEVPKEGSMVIEKVIQTIGQLTSEKGNLSKKLMKLKKYKLCEELENIESLEKLKEFVEKNDIDYQIDDSKNNNIDIDGHISDESILEVSEKEQQQEKELIEKLDKLKERVKKHFRNKLSLLNKIELFEELDELFDEKEISDCLSKYEKLKI